MQIRPILTLAGALLAVACQASPSPSPSKAQEDKPAPAPAPAPADNSNDDGNDGVSEPPLPSPSPSGELAPAPKWFDANAFEHAAIVRQDQAGTRLPTGQTSAMIVLELPAGTTPEQCMDSARAKIGEDVASLPDTGTTPQGYLEMRGKGEGYEFTVVCGVAKDKPTMFLSYIQ